jgi:anti-anti-sigma factor
LVFGAPSLAASTRSAPEVVRVAAPADRVTLRQEEACALSGQQSLLDVIEVREDGRVRVRLRGELDLAGAPTVTERLRGIRERREAVLLDLDELAFIDASGLRALLLAADAAASEGLAFTVTRGSRAVRLLVALVGVDGQLPLDGTAT